MREVLCICELIPDLRLATRVTLLMHWREVEATSNSGRLALEALKNGEMRVRGGIMQGRLETEGLFPKEYRQVILFPTAEARVLTPELAGESEKPLHLIVPDGTWRQAKKVLSREPSLAGLPCVKLPPGPPSNYRLRSSPHEGNISTFEAVARALGILEGEAIQRRLEELFATMVERVLWTRGKLQLSELKTFWPEAALREFHNDGKKGEPRVSRSREKPAAAENKDD
jgi:DTW domain-containing protein YfiP